MINFLLKVINEHLRDLIKKKAAFSLKLPVERFDRGSVKIRAMSKRSR